MVIVYFLGLESTHGGLMVSVPIPRESSPGLSPGRGHCVVFLGKTLDSPSAFPPRSINRCHRIIGKT